MRALDEARKVVPHNNATSLQVTAACLAGAIWAMENPDSFVVEPDEMERRRAAWIAPPLKVQRGTLAKYIRLVKSASEGCVTDELELE